jgi:signal peptidase II
LIASGALGNLIDRFRLGYVVDFIRFHVHEAFVYPTFNVADCTITVGVALLLIEGFIAPRSHAATRPVVTSGSGASTSAQAKTPR